MDKSNNPHILIVDDSEQNIKILQSILSKAGYDISVARNGREALVYLQSKIPDLIVMDIIMPEINGIETCKIIKDHEDFKDIPVIFMTALSDTSEKVKAFEAGGVDYIDRPFVREEVLARINVHVELKKTMAKLKLLSVTDELTGVFNRRFAYQMLDRQIKLAQRQNEQFVVCYLDIDNLKIVNDRYGHQAGDALIVKTINVLGNIIRKSDFIFRMGGDEFLVLFPQANIKESLNLLKRIGKNLKEQKVNDVTIDFSVGFVEYLPSDSITADMLIRKADEAMYHEKFKKKKMNPGKG